MPYQPTQAQRQIMEQMTYHPEMSKTIAARMPPNISRQNGSMQCRIMAANGIIKQHCRGKFSLRPEKEPITFKNILRDDDEGDTPTVVHTQPKPKYLQQKFEREKISVDKFAELFPDHFNWLTTTANRGNSFAQSLLDQLQRDLMLTTKQMVCIERAVGSRTAPGPQTEHMANREHCGSSRLPKSAKKPTSITSAETSAKCHFRT